MRGERSKEIGAAASGILLSEQSTPRHKDLVAGIGRRAVRRAPRLSRRPDDRGVTDVVGLDPTGPAVTAALVRNERMAPKDAKRQTPWAEAKATARAFKNSSNRD